eukprot:jgi/Tetstr1/441546/TSEL_003126.t1
MGDASRDFRIRDGRGYAAEVGARAEGTKRAESLKADAIEEWGGIIGVAGQHLANVHRSLRESEAVQRERIRERARNRAEMRVGEAEVRHRHGKMWPCDSHQRHPKALGGLTWLRVSA